MADRIKLTGDDKAIMKGMNALGRYGGALDGYKRELRKVRKDIGHASNLRALTEAQKHIEEAIKAVNQWNALIDGE